MGQGVRTDGSIVAILQRSVRNLDGASRLSARKAHFSGQHDRDLGGIPRRDQPAFDRLFARDADVRLACFGHLLRLGVLVPTQGAGQRRSVNGPPMGRFDRLHGVGCRADLFAPAWPADGGNSRGCLDPVSDFLETVGGGLSGCGGRNRTLGRPLFRSRPRILDRSVALEIPPRNADRFRGRQLCHACIRRRSGCWLG